MSNKKLIYGIGLNDADYQVYITENVNGKQKNIWVCPFYKVWTNILIRCKSESCHSKRVTYRDCTIVSEWLSFMAFRKWMIKQDYNGMHLDKDILFPNNKIYSPDTCIFVPPYINTFIIDRKNDRGEWPIGVRYHKPSHKFDARCNDPFTKKNKYLGLFDNPLDAHEAWRSYKHAIACKYAEQQTDPRLAKALRSRYAKEGEAQ